MKVLSGFLALCLLAACGADGPPIRPQMTNTVSVGTGGVSTSTSVTVKSGPVTVGAQL